MSRLPLAAALAICLAVVAQAEPLSRSMDEAQLDLESTFSPTDQFVRCAGLQRAQVGLRELSGDQAARLADASNLIAAAQFVSSGLFDDPNGLSKEEADRAADVMAKQYEFRILGLRAMTNDPGAMPELVINDERACRSLIAASERIVERAAELRQ
ncbi:MAG: hypothetical protein ACMVY4_12255 [Minwuia sp.]|uniref:hypothetical protein n=1 Tax=Minwuia sp. TaxID=2493630 RepID=UPI003A848ED1